MDKLKKGFIEIIPYVLIIFIVILIKSFIVSPIKVNGSSMYPTLQDGDVMILDKVSYKFNDIKRFDIVVAKWNNEYIIKRVIGLPGDNVEIKDNILYINGKEYKEDYIFGESPEDFSTRLLGRKVVPSGYYILLGDNRQDSIDSRYFGFISKNNIIGKSKVTLLPVVRFGIKK